MSLKDTHHETCILIPAVAPTETIISSPTTDSVQPTMSVTQCGTGEMPDGNGGCSPCQSGFFKAGPENTNCIQCPTNTDTNGQTGRTSCSKSTRQNNFLRSSLLKLKYLNIFIL